MNEPTGEMMNVFWRCDCRNIWFVSIYIL